MHSVCAVQCLYCWLLCWQYNSLLDDPRLWKTQGKLPFDRKVLNYVVTLPNTSQVTVFVSCYTEVIFSYLVTNFVNIIFSSCMYYFRICLGVHGFGKYFLLSVRQTYGQLSPLVAGLEKLQVDQPEAVRLELRNNVTRSMKQSTSKTQRVAQQIVKKFLL
jgi:hypothetical protein